MGAIFDMLASVEFEKGDAFDAHRLERNQSKGDIMKTTTMLMVLLLAFVAVAADVTWTGDGEDLQWGTGANWSTKEVPGESDTAKILVTTNVFMGADRTVGKLNLGTIGDDSMFNIDGTDSTTGGKYTLTLAQGNIDGGLKAVINANIYVPVNGSWTCNNGYGSKIVVRGNVSGPGGLTFGGGQNRNLHILGGGVFSVPSVYCSLGGVQFDCSFVGTKITLANSWSDGNGNRTGMTMRNHVTFDKNCEFWTGPCGGVLSFNNSDVPEAEHLPCIPYMHHTSGKLSLNGDFYGGTNLCTVTEFVRDTGTLVTMGITKRGSESVSLGVNAGYKIDNASNNAAGIWAPWAINNYLFLKVNDQGALVQTDINADYTEFPEGGVGCDGSTKYKYTTANQSLSNDTTMYSFLHYCGQHDEFALGDHDLRLKGGVFIYQGNGEKRVTSSGGRLVFEGDDIILGMSGNSNLVINAPMAWDRGTAAADAHPSLICSQLGMPIVLAGEDHIGTYSNMMAECGKDTRYIDFSGPSDRTIRGSIAGRFHIWKTGSGNLTFDCVNQRRGGGLYLYAGKTYMAAGTAPGVTIATNGAEVVIAENVSWSGCTLYKDGILDGYGTYNAGYTPAKGGIIGGGETDRVGTLSVNGDFKINDTIGFLCSIDEESNSCLQLIGNKRKFTLPPEGTELVVKVGWSGDGNVNVSRRTFKFFDWSTSSSSSVANQANVIAWKIENLSPRRIDTSAATVAIDFTNKCIVLSGVKNKSATVITIR